jgi:hypothetical protein
VGETGGVGETGPGGDRAGQDPDASQTPAPAPLVAGAARRSHRGDATGAPRGVPPGGRAHRVMVP